MHTHLVGIMGLFMHSGFFHLKDIMVYWVTTEQITDQWKFSSCSGHGNSVAIWAHGSVSEDVPFFLISAAACT